LLATETLPRLLAALHGQSIIYLYGKDQAAVAATVTEFAQRLKLAGGSIRNILVLACYLAASEGAPVHMHHLQHAARRDLYKMGRIVQEVDL
jgi:hypothetical protein